MTAQQSTDYDEYFRHRNVAGSSYADYRLPPYLAPLVPADRRTAILDIGCGFGQMLGALRAAGYSALAGVDLSAEAVAFCREQGLAVEQCADLCEFCRRSNRRYDFIIMSHVLEHLAKEQIIETLQAVRSELLAPGGSLLVMVPNAQSNTGCYWRYEDFTHTTLFTAGSLHYVLKAAGFASVEFVDPDGTAGNPWPVKLVRRFLLAVYRLKLRFWNRVTRSAFHRPSPQIFTYEVKALAR